MSINNAFMKVVKPIFPQLNHKTVSNLLPVIKDRRLVFLLKENWNLALLREWRNARLFKKTIEEKKVKRVFIFSYSRSGTHNFVSRFHYFPCVFCFREHAFESTDDPFQFGVNISRLTPLHYLSSSMFREYGLQDKEGKNLSHAFLWNNRLLEYKDQLALTNFNPLHDTIIFYVRNIFRTLYSRDKSSSRIGKPKPRFKIDDAAFEFAIRQHRHKMEEMYQLSIRHPNAVMFCFHEVFCAQPKVIIEEISNFLNIPSEMTVDWETPQLFFKKCFGSDHSPEIKDGKLWCNQKQNNILGTGGKFNPLSYPNLERTMKDPVEELISPHRYNLAIETFGKELVDFWLHDGDFPYNQQSSGQILELIARSLSK